jgi:hypothetical protein
VWCFGVWVVSKRPAPHLDRDARPVPLNVLWPQIEVNWTYYAYGQRGGPTKSFRIRATRWPVLDVSG